LDREDGNYATFGPSNANIFGRQITVQIAKDF